MITKSEFEQIHKEVKDVTEETFNALAQKFPEKYAMFLADCEYEKMYEGEKFSPYKIDNANDRFKDESRREFLVKFLKTFYSFPSGHNEVDNDEFRIQMELMIYTHIWESKAHLKMLHRLAHLLNCESYNWEVNILDMSKHEFIRKDTKDIFLQHGCSMGDLMEKGFHSSLRNAFSHSEYSLDTMNKVNRINLYNYKGDDSWEMKTISFDEWSKRFVYSALLSYFLLAEKVKRRQNIHKEFGANIFQIQFPPTNNLVKIEYNPVNDGFSFVKP